MQKHQLEHLIRAAAAITNEYEFVIVGSQSILGSVDFPPSECTLSEEADIYPLNAEELSDLIDGSIGEGSMFHERYHYYAQGVDSKTATLPNGWKNRLTRLQSELTDGRIGYCLDPTDLFLSKCVANREKDKTFNLALLNAGIVNASEAIARVNDLPIAQDRQQLVRQSIERLQKLHKVFSEHKNAQPSKSYLGEIVFNYGTKVIQDVGRETYIAHELSQLDSKPSIGSKVTIKYNAQGLGKVEPRGQETNSELSR